MNLFQSKIHYDSLCEPPVLTSAQTVTCNIHKCMVNSSQYIQLADSDRDKQIHQKTKSLVQDIEIPADFCKLDLKCNLCTCPDNSLVPSTPSTKHEFPVTKPKLGTYVIEATVGKGMFSSVKLARHTITGLNVAIKIIDKSRLNDESLKKVYRESHALKELHHESIVKLYQVMETERLLCVVMEYLPNGEVFDYIAVHGRFPESEARQKFYNVVRAIDYAHSLGIVHRDLKAENLLFDGDMNIKLVDFSFGTRLNRPDQLLTTWCGSPPYAAPEIFIGEPYIGTKADIWSLGVVLYVLVCGSLPFDAQLLPHLKNQVLSANFRVPYWLSMTCENLIRQMLTREPYKRPTATQILQHDWFTASCVCKMKTSSLPDTIALSPASERPLPIGVGTVPPCINSIVSNTKLIDQQYSHLCLGGKIIKLKLPSPNLAEEMQMGEFNELILLIMESYGMAREQIMESLRHCAYDHLTATYLLLGIKIRLHHQNLLTSTSIYTDKQSSVPSIQRYIRSTDEAANPAVLHNSYSHNMISSVDCLPIIVTQMPRTQYEPPSLIPLSTSHCTLPSAFDTLTFHTAYPNVDSDLSIPDSSASNHYRGHCPHHSNPSAEGLTPCSEKRISVDDEQSKNMAQIDMSSVHTALDRPVRLVQEHIFVERNPAAYRVNECVPCEPRALKRRKYGVHAAPTCLDQLTESLREPDRTDIQFS